MRALFRVHGFFAFLLVAFINAFVDAGHKVIIQSVLFKSFDGNEQVLLTAIVNALVLLPFILLFSPSGYLSDRFAKPKVMRLSAASSVVIAVLVTMSYWQGWFVISFALTFVLAIQSAIYSPSKYGFVRELVGIEQISEGNAWLQAVTMISILLGILVFSAGFELLLVGADMTDAEPADLLAMMTPLGFVLIAITSLETYFAWRLPERHPATPSLAFDKSAYIKGQMVKANVALLLKKRAVWLSVFGVALFWTLCQVLLAVYPAYAKVTFVLDNAFFVQAVMALSGLGIMAGSLWAGVLSRHQINLALIPIGALGLALALLVLPSVSGLWVHCLVFFAVGFFGALANVPLNALIQSHSEEQSLGRVLAASNLVQNVMMIAGLALTVLAAWWQWSAGVVIWWVALAAVMGAVIAVWCAPDALLRTPLLTSLRSRYKVDVTGFEHLPTEGKGGLLLGNHISWLDWAVVQMASPRPIRFVIDKQIYSRWYLRWFLDLHGVIPISDTLSRGALVKVRELINQGEVVCLFPEGMISFTGQLGPFKKGFERACVEANGVIVPFYLRGLWGSRFSRASKRYRQGQKQGLRRDVMVTFGAPMPIESNGTRVKQAVFSLSVSSWQHHTDALESIPQGFIRSMCDAKTKWALVDGLSKHVSHLQLLAAVFEQAKVFRSQRQSHIAILLPTGYEGVVANLAIICAGKVPINLNPQVLGTSEDCEATCRILVQLGVSVIYSEASYLRQLEGRGLSTQAFMEGFELLEPDIKRKGCIKHRVARLRLLSFMPQPLRTRILLSAMGRCAQSLDETAVVALTKRPNDGVLGVALSHRNIMSNIKQAASVLNVTEQDSVLASLPIHSSFGLALGVMLPLFEGIPVVLVPDPSRTVRVAKAVAFHQTTLMFNQANELTSYIENQKLHPKLLASLRAVIIGGDQLTDDVKSAFESRFHCEVLAGYGCTEATAAVSCNLPDVLVPQWAMVQVASKVNTVGHSLPGGAVWILSDDNQVMPAGEEGWVTVGGAQVANGYVGVDAEASTSGHLPLHRFVERDGVRWFLTGDRGYVDDDGFLVITQLEKATVKSGTI